MLIVKDISKNFGEFKAINHLSFEVKVGDVMGFLGPNGAGKTTSMRVITGYLRSDGGTVLINNKDIEQDPIFTKSMIGYLPEGVPLYLDFSPYLYLDYVCQVRNIKNSSNAIKKVISDLQLEEVKDVLNSLVNFEKDFFIDLENIFVCGDSAGGNLATFLSISSRDKKVIPIRGQLLVYPCVDLTLTMRSMDIFLEGMTLTFDTMDYFVKHYLNSSNDAVNWEASPLFAKNLHNLPETFIFAAGLDPLLDEGMAYASRLKTFSNKVTYKLYPGQIHGFLSNSAHFPKAAECIKEIGKAANSMVLNKRG